MELLKFYIYSLETGISLGWYFKARNRQDAETQALNRGYNIYDDYGLTLDKPSTQRLTEKQVNFLNRNN